MLPRHAQFPSRLVVCLAVVGGLWGGSAAAVPAYDFIIDAPNSGLDATLTVPIDTSGTLIGNYDATSNPTGTRTKPGLFGSFGATENVAVAVTVNTTVSGNPQTHPVGSFQLALDPAGGTVTLAGLTADLLGGTSVVLPVSATVETESFRTRNPTSTYPGGIPVTLPLGNATLSQLEVAQLDPAAVGTLTEIGPGTYSFVVAPLVNVTATIEFMGNTQTPPPTPTAFPLEGQIVVTGTTAYLTSVHTIDYSNSQAPGTTLPQFPLDLPTVLPPGSTAHVLMDLVLNSIGLTLSGSSTFAADGLLTGPAVCRGDCDCDGHVGFSDIDYFVAAIPDAETAWAALYAQRHGGATPPCRFENCDVTGDGHVNFADIDPFVALIPSTCP